MTKPPLFALADLHDDANTRANVQRHINNMSTLYRQRRHVNLAIRNARQEAYRAGLNGHYVQEAAKIISTGAGPEGYFVRQNMLRGYVEAGAGQQLDLTLTEEGDK